MMNKEKRHTDNKVKKDTQGVEHSPMGAFSFG